jgi:hypothetical protein
LISRYVEGQPIDQRCCKLTIEQSDPYQTNNLADVTASAEYRIAGRPLNQILTRLNALIMVLKTCKNRVCTHPWEVLHPGGSVYSLKHALNERFDAFYGEQPQMWFSECPLGYFAEVENQEPVSTFGPGLRKQGFDWANHWHYFT